MIFSALLALSSAAFAGNNAPDYRSTSAGFAANGILVDYTKTTGRSKFSNMQLGYSVGLRMAGGDFSNLTLTPWLDVLEGGYPESGLFLITSITSRVEYSDRMAIMVGLGTNPLVFIESAAHGGSYQEIAAYSTGGLLAELEGRLTGEVEIGDSGALRAGFRPAIYSAMLQWPIVDDVPLFALALVANPAVEYVHRF